jgi:hypothetical protein
MSWNAAKSPRGGADCDDSVVSEPGGYAAAAGFVPDVITVLGAAGGDA